jgi:hypothetical protein
MTIRLNWNNRNTAYDEIRIYRATTRFDTANPPEPIGVVTNADFYDDTTALLNVVYYYALGIVKGTDVVISPIKVLANMPYTGPGRQKPLRGDYERGYFGELAPGEFIGADELCATLGLVEGTPTTVVDRDRWHKFIFQGKILFIPQVSSRQSVSWQQLYDRGLAYGVDGVGTPPSGSPGVNQMRTVVKGADEFIVRLPRAKSDGVYSTAGEDFNSEWHKLVTPLCRDSSVNSEPKWSDYGKAEFFPSGYLYNWFAECNGTYALTSANGNFTTTNNAAVTNSGNQSFRPVLELVL